MATATAPTPANRMAAAIRAAAIFAATTSTLCAVMVARAIAHSAGVELMLTGVAS